MVFLQLNFLAKRRNSCVSCCEIFRCFFFNSTAANSFEFMPPWLRNEDERDRSFDDDEERFFVSFLNRRSLAPVTYACLNLFMC